MVGASIFSQFTYFKLKFMQTIRKEHDLTPHFWHLILALYQTGGGGGGARFILFSKLYSLGIFFLLV